MKTRTFSTGILLATICAVLLMAGSVLAKGAKTPNPNNGHGKITAMSATSITVTPKDGPAKTFTISSATKVMLDGQPATASALTTGLHAKIKSADGVAASVIKAHTKRAKGSKTAVIPTAATT